MRFRVEPADIEADHIGSDGRTVCGRDADEADLPLAVSRAVTINAAPLAALGDFLARR